MIEINLNPSDRDLRTFGWLLLAFAGLVGVIALWKAAALLGAATVLTVAVLVGVALNSGSPRGRQMLGFLLPGLFGCVGGAVAAGAPALVVAGVVWALGVAASVQVWSSPGFAKTVYIGWMSAAEPIGWTISCLIMAMVFYLVLTPMGVVMRKFGYDPMQRKLDPEAASYWEPRKPVTDIKRYFRQF